MNPHEERTLVLGGVQVRDLRKLEDEEVLLGKITLFGDTCHVIFIRVVEDENLGQHAVDDPHHRWEAMVEAEPEGCFETIEVPGFEGEYVFFTNSNVR